MTKLHWSLFCRVIDNFGDAGVCLRLAKDLAHRHQRITLWCDQPELLTWMAPDLNPLIEVKKWSEPVPNEACPHPSEIGAPAPVQSMTASENASGASSDVYIEAFGCELPPAVQELIAVEQRCLDGSVNPTLHSPAQPSPVWINLEYLSAESYVKKSHALLSPVLSGPGAGAQKWFFYPGFESGTGGLILEPQMRKRILEDRSGIKLHAPHPGQKLKVGLFCYPSAPIQGLLQTLSTHDLASGCALRVAAGAAQDIVKQALSDVGSIDPVSSALIHLNLLPLLTQDEFDDYLWSNDLNFVRGEDSLTRAIWTAKPWIWQIYPQADGAHLDKLNALLDLFSAPDFVKELHWRWNQSQENTDGNERVKMAIPSAQDAQKWKIWHTWCRSVRDKLLLQDDLSTQLLAFVQMKRQKTVEY